MTFVFADIAGSTRLSQSLDPGIYARVLGRYRRIVRRCLPDDGIEIMTERLYQLIAPGLEQEFPRPTIALAGHGHGPPLTVHIQQVMGDVCGPLVQDVLQRYVESKLGL